MSLGFLFFLYLTVISDSKQDNEQDISVKTRIIGGRTAREHEYPYQVALVSQSNYFLCGGTIIGDRHVLTAGHCVSDKNGLARDPRSFKIFFGMTDLLNHDSVKTSLVKAIHVHPEYMKNGVSNNDIAVMQTEDPIVIQGLSASALLPENDVYEGEEATASGFGQTDSTSLSHSLMAVELKVLPDQECHYQSRFKSDIMFCAGVTGGGKSTCMGDSGGPLVNRDNEVIGVVSFGPDPCAQEHRPAIFVRVHAFNEWIENVVRTNETNVN